MDVVFIVLIIGLFAASWGFVRLCEQVKGK